MENKLGAKFWWVVGAAILVGLFSVWPSLHFLSQEGAGFKGVWPQFDGDSYYYMTRIREVLDGHKEINHPYFYEHKNDVYPQATGGERFVAFVNKIFGTNPPDIQPIFDFLVPIIIFTLSYFLFSKLAKNYWAIILPLVLYTVVSGTLAKPINPQISLPLLIIFFLFWFKLWSDERNKWLYTLGSGVVLGLLFLTYFFNWSFVVSVVGIGLIFLIGARRWQDLKYQIVLLVVGFVIGIPYFLLILKGFSTPYHAETAVRVGVFFSHLPETLPRTTVALLWLGFFLVFARRYKLDADPRAQFIGILLIGNVIYPNHQLITGVIIQNANHWSFMPPFIYFLSAHYMWEILNRNGFVFRKAVAERVFALALILFIVVPAVRLSTFNFHPYIRAFSAEIDPGLGRYAPVFDWINQNTPADSVVFSDEKVMSMVSVYTHANVYYTNYAFNLPASNKEVVERDLLSNFFNKDFFESPNFNMTEDGRILWTQPAQSERNTHKIYDYLGESYKKEYPLEREVAYVSSIYNSLKSEGWRLALLKKYRLDYIVWDTKRNPTWGLEGYTDLRGVAEVGDFKIFSFVR